MAKKRNLAEALQEATESRDVVVMLERAPSDKVPTGRVGMKAITGFFDPAVSKQLKQIALEEDSSIQALLREALNDLFTKRGKSPIA